METRARFLPTAIASAARGDLVGVRNENGFDYGLVVERNVNDDVIVAAILRPADPSQGPYMTWIPDGLECANYGNDWLFELDDELSFDLSTDTAGTAFVAEDGPYLRLRSDPDAPTRVRGAALNMNSITPASPRGRVAVSSGWRLWVHVDDRRDDLASPLIQFPLPEIE